MWLRVKNNLLICFICCNFVQKESSMTWGLFHHMKHLQWQSSKENSFVFLWPELKVRIYLVLQRLNVWTLAARSKKLLSCTISQTFKIWLLVLWMIKLNLEILIFILVSWKFSPLVFSFSSGQTWILTLGHLAFSQNVYLGTLSHVFHGLIQEGLPCNMVCTVVNNQERARFLTRKFTYLISIIITLWYLKYV